MIDENIVNFNKNDTQTSWQWCAQAQNAAQGINFVKQSKRKIT